MTPAADILIIEDDDGICEMLQILLSSNAGN